MNRPPRYSLSRPEDETYFHHVRELLSAPPCKGLPHEPTQLLPHIYIGSQRNAESLRLLRHHGITHVLNCAGYKGPRPPGLASPYAGLDIDYYEFQAEDNDLYDISRHFSEAFTYLDKVKRAGGVALVHCALGVNRSGAICAAYMLKTTHTPLLETLKTLKRKRRIVLTNHGFQRQLVRFAKAKGLLEELNGHDGCDRLHGRASMALRRHEGDVLPRAARASHHDDRLRSASFEDVRRERAPVYPVGASPSRAYRSAIQEDASLRPGGSLFEKYLQKQRDYICH